MKTREYWAGHEYVREHARRTTELSHGYSVIVRLVEILRTQWNEDYFKHRPFVRLNGEDFGTFRLLDDARKCFDNVEKIYNRAMLACQRVDKLYPDLGRKKTEEGRCRVA